MTGYRAIVGPDAAFTPDFRPVRHDQITDGIRETLLVGETREGVPWMKPEDLHVDWSVPLSGLGSHHGYHDNGFNLLFADGHVRFLQSKTAAKILGALMTRSGGEDLSQFEDETP